MVTRENNNKNKTSGFPDAYKHSEALPSGRAGHSVCLVSTMACPDLLRSLEERHFRVLAWGLTWPCSGQMFCQGLTTAQLAGRRIHSQNVPENTFVPTTTTLLSNTEI